MATAAFVNVPLPLNIYYRLERTAQHLKKPVETLLSETLQAALPATDEIPEKIQLELANLTLLEIPELRQIAQSEMTLDDQQVLEQLLDLQGMRPLTNQEMTQLESLRTEYGRVLLRKARAFAILAKRGQPLPFK